MIQQCQVSPAWETRWHLQGWASGGRPKAQITHGRAVTEYGLRRPSRTQACFTRGVSANGRGSHRLTRASPQAPAQLQGARRPSSH